MKKRPLARWSLGLGRACALAVFIAAAVFPLAWIIATSLKDQKEIYAFPLRYWPASPTFDSYRKLFGFAEFRTYFLNSLGVTLAASFGGLLVSLPAGFALSRIPSEGLRKKNLLLLYFTQMIPGFMLMTPLYRGIARLGLADNLAVLAIVYAAMTVAFGAIMAKGFFDRVPPSIEEAALIDGCSPLSALARVILPLSLPGLFAIFSFNFLNTWNELFLAVVLLSSERKMTVPVALNSFISKAGVSWDILSAGIVVALLPTILLFALGRKYIIEGLTEGGTKG